MSNLRGNSTNDRFRKLNESKQTQPLTQQSGTTRARNARGLPLQLAGQKETNSPEMLTKRLTKFLLKRLLGKYIVCDLDLDQLDVELRTGLIHLKDIDLGIDVRTCVFIFHHILHYTVYTLFSLRSHTLSTHVLFTLQAINDLLGSLPIRIKSGFARSVTVQLPYTHVS